MTVTLMVITCMVMALAIIVVRIVGDKSAVVSASTTNTWYCWYGYGHICTRSFIYMAIVLRESTRIYTYLDRISLIRRDAGNYLILKYAPVVDSNNDHQ